MTNAMYSNQRFMLSSLLLSLIVGRPSAIGAYRLLENSAQDNVIAASFEPNLGRKVATSGPNNGGHSFPNKLKTITQMQKDAANYRPNLGDNSFSSKKQILTEKDVAPSGPNPVGNKQALFVDTQIPSCGPSPGDGHKYTNGLRVTEKNKLASVATVSSVDIRHGPTPVVTELKKGVTLSFDIFSLGSSPGVGHK